MTFEVTSSMFEERATVVCGLDIKAILRPHLLIGSPHNRILLFARMDRGPISVPFSLSPRPTGLVTTSICPKLSETHSSPMPFYSTNRIILTSPCFMYVMLDLQRRLAFALAFQRSTEVENALSTSSLPAHSTTWKIILHRNHASSLDVPIGKESTRQVNRKLYSKVSSFILPGCFLHQHHHLSL
ncbi:hypothetical protein CPC08DRAFT_235589 [Agrocybe pediades]|nr:hypothetical protein CPC08DRAFT_235589 [Agrocybe pediades]